LIDEDSTPRESSPLPVLKEDVEDALRSLPTGKSPGADNIPAKLLKHEAGELVTVVTSICQQIWETKQWPEEWTQSLIIPMPKKGMSKLNRTISLISHTSKIMLRVILKGGRTLCGRTSRIQSR
jgi:hypothetical protein